MEATLASSSLKGEHRALISATLQGFRSAEAGMREVFKGLVTSFEVCFSFVLRVISLFGFIYKSVYPP